MHKKFKEMTMSFEMFYLSSSNIEEIFNSTMQKEVRTKMKVGDEVDGRE